MTSPQRERQSRLRENIQGALRDQQITLSEASSESGISRSCLTMFLQGHEVGPRAFSLLNELWKLVENPSANRSIQKNLKALEVAYHRALKRILGRIRNGGSIRQQAQKIGLSHAALNYIVKNPEKHPQRKTMIKVIRATERPKTRRKVVHPITGKWCQDSI